MPDTNVASTDLIAVKPEIAAAAHIDRAAYQQAYAAARDTPDSYWAKVAERLDWISKPTKIKDVSFTGDVHIKWFEDGVLNASVQCLDRHIAAGRR